MLHLLRSKFFAPLTLIVSLGVLFLFSFTIFYPSRAQSVNSSPQAERTPCPTCGGGDDKPHTLAASY